MRWVTFDQGNSSLKWCLWEAALGDCAKVSHRGRAREGALEDGLQELAEHLDGSSVEAAFYCGVTGEERAAIVRACWKTISGGMPWREPVAELENECEDPDAVGQDRLFAAQAADRLKGDAIVVDAGTALTVDAVRSGPTFLGGAIAPGPEVLADALERAGAKLISIDPRPGASALGRSTAAALEAGISVGFRGAAAGLVDEVSSEADLSSAPVILTGGARSYLSCGGLFGERAVHAFADLVHLGILVSVGVDADLEEEPWPSS